MCYLFHFAFFKTTEPTLPPKATSSPQWEWENFPHCTSEIKEKQV